MGPTELKKKKKKNSSRQTDSIIFWSYHDRDERFLPLTLQPCIIFFSLDDQIWRLLFYEKKNLTPTAKIWITVFSSQTSKLDQREKCKCLISKTTNHRKWKATKSTCSPLDVIERLDSVLWFLPTLLVWVCPRWGALRVLGQDNVLKQRQSPAQQDNFIKS